MNPRIISAINAVRRRMQSEIMKLKFSTNPRERRRADMLQIRVSGVELTLKLIEGVKNVEIR
jgi:hypothetical protein